MRKRGGEGREEVLKITVLVYLSVDNVVVDEGIVLQDL